LNLSPRNLRSKAGFKRIDYTLRKGLLYKAGLCWVGLVLCACAYSYAAEERLLGDVSDGSRAAAVHKLNLFDPEGNKILQSDELQMPFSTRQTCGSCHSYKTISTGRHFNSVDPNAVSGRVGQPWILVDAATGTQVPLSYRSWSGTFKPSQLGISAWKFTCLFGRQMPGGGAGELESDIVDEVVRQGISGKLEINCLACHNAHAGQNQAEYADQIARQNFRWAATGACEFASVSGSAKEMPDTYDPLMPDTSGKGPAVFYRKDAFDHKGKILFNIVR
jgi:hypothetical protein